MDRKESNNVSKKKRNQIIGDWDKMETEISANIPAGAL